MNKSTVVHPAQEPFNSDHKHLLCWRAVSGGFFVALMAFVALTAFGAAVAGVTAEHLISQESGGTGLATGAGLYLGLSIVVALFCGGYFALRISRFVTTRIGAAHGLVIASIFFLVMVLGVGNLIGGVAAAFGELVKASGNSAATLATNSQVEDAFNQAVGTSNLKSTPKEVIQGLTARLVQGDTESAKNYLAYQTGQTPTDVDAKITEAKAKFDAAAKTASEKAAHVVADTGLIFFVIFLVGLVSGAIGGRVGANANVDRPIATSSSATSLGFAQLRTEGGSVVPYIFGWLLGVPVSILLLIAMLRTVF